MAQSLMLGLTFAALCAALIALGSWTWIRLREASRDLRKPGGDQTFSAARYDPMARLLSPQDLEFLARQPGVNPKIVSRWKKDRRKIFRTYLWELAADFQLLHARAKEMAANAPAEHAALFGVLLGQQTAFWRAFAGVQLGLALDGFGGFQVDIAGLLNIVREMERSLNPAFSAA